MIKLIYYEKENIYKNKTYTIKRESGKSPNGNKFRHRWVLRENTGKFIDFDQFRHDLAERNKINIQHQ